MSKHEYLLPPGCIVNIADVEHILNQWHHYLTKTVKITNTKGGKTEGDIMTIVGGEVVWNSPNHNLLDGTIHPDTIAGTPGAGDLVTGSYDSIGKWEILEPGTSGLFLKSNGAGASLTWDTPADTNTDVYIGTVTGDSPSDTVAPCDKITFAGATVEDKGDGDALVTINSGFGGSGGGIEMSEWVDANVAAYSGEDPVTYIWTIDESDWRDRLIQYNAAFFTGTPSEARSNGWNSPYTLSVRGVNAGAAGGARDVTDGNYELANFSGPIAGAWILEVNYSNGHLELHITLTDGQGPYRVQFWISAMATSQQTTPDITAYD